MKNFILQLAILAIVSIGAYHLLGVFNSPYYFPYHPLIAAFFYVVTLLFHNGLNKSLEKSNQHFIRYFMGATGVKLMVILLFVIVVALTNKAIAMNFTLCTFFYYIFFSTFEVWVSMKHFGKKA
jgi:hypothetical protein